MQKYNKILSKDPQAFVLLFVLTTSVWTWRLFMADILVLFCVIFTVVLFHRLREKKDWFVVGFCMFLLIFFQWWTSEHQSLTQLSNDQIRIRDERLGEYPPTSISIGSKTLWLPFGYWFEAREESTAAQRLLTNFFQSVDINYYFFSNHPRERVGYTEHEKFPYVFFPFFAFGVFSLVEKRKFAFFLMSLILPVIVTSIIGTSNDMGIFSVFPFFVLSISEGFGCFVNLQPIKKLSKHLRVGLLLMVLLLIFTSFLYEIV